MAIGAEGMHTERTGELESEHAARRVQGNSGRSSDDEYLRIGGRPRAIWDFMKLYSSVEGRPPTIKEIAYQVGITSTGNVHFHLEGLAMRGYLIKIGGRGSSRNYVVNWAYVR